MASENIAKKRRPKSDAIYTEVMPTMTQKSACFRLPDVVEEEDDMYAKVNICSISLSVQCRYTAFNGNNKGPLTRKIVTIAALRCALLFLIQ